MQPRLRLVRGAPASRARVLPTRPVAVPPWPDGFTAAVGTACLLWQDGGQRLLVGLGETPNRLAAEQAGALAAARLAGARHIVLDGRTLAPDAAIALAIGAALRAARPPDWHTSPPPEDAPEPPARLDRIDLLVDDPDALAAPWEEAQAVLRGVLWARHAVTMPANLLTPERFCRALGRLRRLGLDLEVLRRGALRRGGLGALLAVGQASAHPPRLAVLRWPGRGGGAPVALVGKGITFDTGGISIKPADHMWEMRADMAGAAAAVGAVIAAAIRRSPMPVVAVLALAENAVGANAYRPGDVLRAVDGTFIEVVDTDAEGRLVLADALAWTRAHLHPRAMISLATLTGAIVVALGHERAGLFDNNATLATAAADAGAEVGEKLWRMPIGEEDVAALESDIADLRHCHPGRMQPDACQAAAFLRHFVRATPWAHLDIAGVESWADADESHPAGASGFGVRLLDRLLARHFEAGAE